LDAVEWTGAILGAAVALYFAATLIWIVVAMVRVCSERIEDNHFAAYERTEREKLDREQQDLMNICREEISSLARYSLYGAGLRLGIEPLTAPDYFVKSDDDYAPRLILADMLHIIKVAIVGTPGPLRKHINLVLAFIQTSRQSERSGLEILELLGNTAGDQQDSLLTLKLLGAMDHRRLCM
jgi:hypothetical protein